jgi:hypothetical protein
MSRYGPPGSYPEEPYGGRHGSPHDEPADPDRTYRQAGPEDPYRPPADPWGQPTQPWGQEPTQPWGQEQPTQPWGQEQPTQPVGQRGAWTDLTRPQPGYDPTAHHPPYQAADYGWGAPPEPPARRPWLAVLLVLLVLLVAGGVAVTLFWVSGGEEPDQAGGSTTGPGGGSTATGPATPGGETGPEDRIGLSATVAQVDDCLVNDGSSQDPVMRIVDCDADESPPVYRILARFDERVTGATEAEQDESAQQICLETDGYEFHYRFVAAAGAGSFVLCLAEE